jgi:hypothetical protein
MTPALHTHLTCWLHWAENGAPRGKPFWRFLGLCTNTPYLLRAELYKVLEADFGDRQTYPFGGEEQYNAERDDCTAYLNPQRLAWVRGKVGR